MVFFAGGGGLLLLIQPDSKDAASTKLAKTFMWDSCSIDIALDAT